MTKSYDVVVVGARVAGASTALLLARAGLKVALVDRSAYGSDTLSTHALMRAGVLQLSRWGVLPEVRAAGTPAVEKVLFHYADGDSVQVSIRPSPGVGALYAPRRHVVDKILVDAAAAAGVDVQHGVTVTGLLDADGRVGGVRATRRDGTSFEVPARFTVGADGIRSVVADQVAAPVERRSAALGASLYRYHGDLCAAGYEWGYGG
ncbi:MAG TPA: FAD-dependent monooxygenase, partial [Ornithinibacter sp.]|nr:FAD-dependent monooxygenase [Ornithinibacter sp.]